MNLVFDYRKLFEIWALLLLIFRRVKAVGLHCWNDRSTRQTSAGEIPMSGLRPLVLCVASEFECSRHKAVLKRYGYDVIGVTGSSEGCSVLRTNPVDAIILDLETRFNGDAVVRRLKEINPHVPLLLLASPLAKIPSGRYPAADAVILKIEPPSRLVRILDHLLDIKYPFFIRWFGNWKSRRAAGA